MIWASLGLLVLVSVHLMVDVLVERPELARMQNADDERNVQRIDRVYESVLEDLSRRAHRQATMPGTYAFAVDLNPDFIRANIVEATFVERNIDGMALFDVNDNLLHASSFDRKTAGISEGLPFSASQLNAEVLSRAGTPVSDLSILSGIGKQGFIRSGRGVLAFAVEDISPINSNAPSRGGLLVWQVLDASFIAGVAHQVALNYAVQPVNSNEVILDDIDQAQAQSKPLHKEGRQLVWALKSTTGEPLLYHELSFEQGYLKDGLLTLSVVAEVAVSITLVVLSLLMVKVVFLVPLRQLAAITRSIADSKDYRREITLSAASEFEQVAVQFNALLRTVDDQDNQLQTQNLKLRLENIRDPLTGVSNRRYLDEYLERCWKWSREESQPFAVVLVDVDSFKAFNDSHGHTAGDKVLKSVAMLLKNSLGNTDGIIARYGGEEFCAVLIGQNEKKVRGWCESVVDEIRYLDEEDEPADISPISISVGVAYGTAADYHQLRHFFKVAKTELHRSKDEGKNCVNFSDVA